MITKEQIISLAEEAMKDTDRYVVNVTISKSNVIELFLDADSSVTIDDCVEVSNYINEKLDRDVEDYELNVSSAGIDEPLLKMRQYKKYIGKDLIVTDIEGVKKMYKLLSFNDEQLEVEEAEAKKYGKLTKVIYHDATTLEINKLKEVRPYIKF
jgi:ribosome maturation factor RimP